MGTGIWLSDVSSAIMMAYAVSIALFARERTDLGQHVEMALLNQTLIMQLPELIRQEKELEGKKKEPRAIMDYLSPYACRDGEYILQVSLTNEQWEGLCSALERTDLVKDPRFDTPLKRSINGTALRHELTAAFKKRERSEWLERLKKSDVPHAPVLSQEDVFQHPQILANDMIVEVDHPITGPTKMLGIPFHLSETPGGIRGPSPLLGQHTREVIRELGYSEAEIEDLHRKGAIGLPAN